MRNTFPFMDKHLPVYNSLKPHSLSFKCRYYDYKSVFRKELFIHESLKNKIHDIYLLRNDMPASGNVFDIYQEFELENRNIEYIDIHVRFNYQSEIEKWKEKHFKRNGLLRKKYISF